MRRGFPITQAMRAERRKRAEDRNEAYAKLTTQQKLDGLPATGAKKQRAKLTALLEKANQKPAAQVVIPKAASKARASKVPVAKNG